MTRSTLVRGVRRNTRSGHEAAVGSGSKDDSGHGVARMERLVRALGGREQANEGIAAKMGQLGARADHAAASLHDETAAELHEHVILRYGTFYGPGT